MNFGANSNFIRPDPFITSPNLVKLWLRGFYPGDLSCCIGTRRLRLNELLRWTAIVRRGHRYYTIR